MTFRARKSPLLIAAGAALLFWCFIALMAVLAWTTTGSEALLAVGLFLSIFAIWFTMIAWQIMRLRAVVSEEGLEITAHGGARVWMAAGLRAAKLRWEDVQGIRVLELPMQEPNYLLFTRQGDFTINGTQFEDAPRLAAEIARRSGRELGAPAPGREATEQEIAKSTQGAQVFLRVCGWVSLAFGVLLLVAAIGTSASTGDRWAAVRVGGIAAMLLGIAARLIRTS